MVRDGEFEVPFVFVPHGEDWRPPHDGWARVSAELVHRGGVAESAGRGGRFPGLRGEPPNPLAEPPGGHDPVGALFASGVLDDDPRRWAGMSDRVWRGLVGDATQAAALKEEAPGPVLMAEVVRPNTALDVGSSSSPVTEVAPKRFIADNPVQWLGKPSVGDGECVALVKKATDAPQTSDWKRGPHVQGKLDIKSGTVIATFDSRGRYDGHPRSIWVRTNGEYR